MKTLIKFITSFPKSYRLAKQCKGKYCLTPLEFHIWRWNKMWVEPKLQKPYDDELNF